MLGVAASLPGGFNVWSCGARVFGAGLLTLLVLPACGGAELAAGAGRLGCFVRELCFGATLGLATGVVVAACGLIAPAAGTTDDADDQSGECGGVQHRWLVAIVLAAFMAWGGHRELLRVVLDSFQTMPPGAGHWPEAGIASLLALGMRFSLHAAQPYLLVHLGGWLLNALVQRHATWWAHVPLGTCLRCVGYLGLLAIASGGLLRYWEGDWNPFLAEIRSVIASWGGTPP